MRKALVGCGATFGVGAAGSQTVGLSRGVAAQDLRDKALFAFSPAGYALGYLVKEGADLFLGDDRDYSGYTGAEALRTEIRSGLVQMRSADERVMTSIQNNLQNSKNVALAKGKSAVLEAMNAGDSESAATTALQSEIDAYYSTIEANILTHGNSQVQQLKQMVDRLDQHGTASPGDVFTVSRSDASSGGYGSPGPISLTSESYTLLDGSTVQRDLLDVEKSGYSGSTVHHLTKEAKKSSSRFYRLFYFDSDGNEVLIPPDYHNILNEVENSRDDVNTTLSGFVTDVYSAYEPGDIPTEELVDPVTAATELSQNYDGEQGQTAFASMLGIPTTAEQSIQMTVHRPDGDVSLRTDIYTEYTPPSTGSFEPGTRYEPSTWDEPIYIGYEFTRSDGTTESDFVQLENPFTITEATNADGEEITSFSPESQNNQTADVSALEEELAQIREEQLRLQEEAQEEMSSGGAGAGFFGGGAPNTGAIAAVLGGVGVVYALFTQEES